MLMEKNHILPRGSLICGQSPIPPGWWAYFDWHLPSPQPHQGPASAVVTGAGKLSLLKTLSAAYWNLSLLPPSFPLGALATQQPLPLLSWPRSWGNTDFYTDSYHDAKVLWISLVNSIQPRSPHIYHLIIHQTLGTSISLSPFHRWGDWGPEKLNFLPKIPCIYICIYIILYIII